MKKQLPILLLLISSVVIISAAIDDGYEIFNPHPINFIIPKGWPQPTLNIFSKNKLTEEGFQLGKKLFYDGNLSKDGEVSCASCHQQFAAFANFDHDLSHGVDNSFTTRNAPALINIAWMKELHWDGAINHIEVQPLAPMTAKNEMGETLKNVLSKLQNDTSYKRMFKAAFGDTIVSSQRLLKSLAQFIGSLVSCNSKYDKVMRGETTFKDYEQRGYLIFKKNCSSCHKEPLFTDNSFRNNGLPVNRFNDIGRKAITNREEDSLKFKVPTLRNIQLTFPYFHDGHTYSIYHVIDHYAKNIDTSQVGLDPILKRKILLTKKESIELVYFLFTLTDSSFIANPRFASNQKIILNNPHH